MNKSKEARCSPTPVFAIELITFAVDFVPLSGEQNYIWLHWLQTADFSLYLYGTIRPFIINIHA